MIMTAAPLPKRLNPSSGGVTYGACRRNICCLAIAAIVIGNLWFLDFVHIFSSLLWTGIDLFMGFVLGSDFAARGLIHTPGDCAAPNTAHPFPDAGSFHHFRDYRLVPCGRSWLHGARLAGFWLGCGRPHSGHAYDHPRPWLPHSGQHSRLSERKDPTGFEENQCVDAALFLCGRDRWRDAGRDHCHNDTVSHWYLIAFALRTVFDLDQGRKPYAV